MQCEMVHWVHVDVQHAYKSVILCETHPSQPLFSGGGSDPEQTTAHDQHAKQTQINTILVYLHKP